MKTLLLSLFMLLTMVAFSQERQFQKAIKSNKVESFDKFIKKFPNSAFTEKAEFKKAELINSDLSYELFLKKYPNGEFSNKAENSLCKIEFSKVEKSTDIELLKAYLNRFPNCLPNTNVAKDALVILEYKKAEQQNTINAYENFLKTYQNNKYVIQTKNNIQILEYEQAQQQNTINAYENFLKTYPNNKYVNQAENNIQRLEYEQAIEKKTIDAYQYFIDKYPQSKFTPEVKKDLIDLEFQNSNAKKSFDSFDSFFEKYPKLSEEYYDKAFDYLGINLQVYNKSYMNYTNSNFSEYIKGRYEILRFNAISDSYNIKELETFVRDFPESNNSNQMKNKINSIKTDKLGKNIFDLISENKVEVEVTGSDITEVSVKIRKLVPYNITVQVPPGTFFISNSTSSQNMVTRRSKNFILSNNEWHENSIYAACANRIKDIPGSDDRFSVQRSPNQKELEILMNTLSKEHVSSEVEQAAIWIVTDDADYDDLGILVVSYNGYGGSRVINEYEAARAIQICAKANISIKNKAIWKDKAEILNGLKSVELKKWLQNY